MKRLFICFIIGLSLLTMLTGVVSASDTSDAIYTGIIKVTNNGTANTSIATTISGINTTSLIADGFLHSSANDSAILRSGSDVAFMPGYGTNPWILYVASIGADTTFNDIFFTPNVPDGKESYFPGSGGMTTSAISGFGDNFTYTATEIFIDTTAGADKYIAYQEDAWSIMVDASTSGKINGIIYEWDDTAVWTSPTGYSDATGEWSNETNAYDENTGTWAYETIPLGSWSEFIIYSVSAIKTDRVRTYCQTQADITQIDVDVYYDSAWHGIYQSTKTQGAWQTHTIGSFETVTQMRIRLYNSDVGSSQNAYLNEVDFNAADGVPLITSSITGITIGEYATVILSADSINMTIDINGTSNSTALSGASVLELSNDIISFENDTVLYAGSQEITVGGNQVQYFEWEYDSTFTDQSGNSNDATPTFRTTSSDADVSASLVEFYPISESTAPAYAVSDAEDFISGAPNITGNFTTSIDVSFPGSEIIEDTATSGGTPVQMPFIWLGCLGLLAASFLTSSIATKFQSSSILPKILVVGIIAAALVGLKVFDFWMLLYLIIPLLAFAVAKTHTTWGGESGYNMAGFLAMSFVGMTIINRIMEGAFLSSTDVSILNNVLVFRPVNVFGLFQISVPNMSFLTAGLPHLIRWDYSFFGGNAVIIQYLFYSITAFMAFLLFIIMLGVVFNMLSRSR